ncbi:serine/threonine protein kinase [Thermoplasmatales archaeon SW_10_69_26]|nr:MAG: serine/threonine protein kinase [Thermoplasmatales archaeon SW_10_69_26]
MPDTEDWEQMVEDAMKSVRYDPNLELADLRKTEAEVFDYPTMKTLSQLINDDVIETLDFCISTGKEANVFHGTAPDGTSLAVKIYRVNTTTFRQHLEYLWGDRRFDPGGKSERDVISLWASKEFRNLRRLRNGNLRVPEPVAVENNIIVMEYIGEDERVAPLLKDVDLAEPRDGYDALVDFIETAWEEADLVHGDLSAYNVLVHPPHLIVIDVAQAIVSDHPRARELLKRDVENVAKHFRSRGVDPDPDAVVDRLVPAEEVA